MLRLKRSSRASMAAASLLATSALAQSNFTCDSSGAVSGYNATSKYLGCYLDRQVSILGAVKLSTIAMTPQLCTNFCGERGYSFGGINFGTQCFCDVVANYANAVKTDDSTCSTKCYTDPSQSCGATYVMSLYQITNPQGNASDGSSSNNFVPACQTSPLCSHQVCNTSLSTAERVASLVGEFDLQEKVLNLVDSAAGSGRLGLPPYEWWNEATHGVGSAPGVQFPNKPANYSYATSFPSPILTAAAFDDALVRAIGEVVGKEGRAFGNGGFAGFDYWAPNMNAFRDPRWGRGQETPGEDIFHVQNYIRNYVPGLQGPDADQKQIIATCKHYAVYDLETGRYGNNYNPTQQDLAEYYLAAFKTCVRDANVGSIMCAYNAVGGYPSCASEYLLEDVLRDHWNFSAPSSYVVSDCGAVSDIYDFHNFTDTVEAAASVALNAGTDLECGQAYLQLNASLADGQVSIDRMDQALNRLYSALFTIGYFDGNEYSDLDFSDVATPDAQNLAYTAAVEGMTLLQNDGLLPITASDYKQVAVIGPYANATTQMQGDYSGTAEYLRSPLSAFQNVTGWNVTYAAGTLINAYNDTGIQAAVDAASTADLIIYLGGIDNSLESETLDRVNLTYPTYQLNLINQLSALGAPMAVITFGGGQVDHTPIFDNANVSSVVWAGYPSQDGGPALLDILTGAKAPAGRLPITQYPAAYADEVSIYEINLRPNANSTGRTYKWYTGTPVRAFGFGLHYTDFAFHWNRTPRHRYDIGQLIRDCEGPLNDNSAFFTVSATVKNVGKHVSDYVGLLFISSDSGPLPRPNKALVSYERVHDVAVGGSMKLTLPLTLGSLARADEDGNLVVYPGKYKLMLDVDACLVAEFELTGQAAVIETLPKQKAEYDFTVPVHVQAPSYQAYS
ncbi:hypothetical protein LTR53_003190 [Teratosphaeriaceae sp. CCFEE 6253]|nr:hypothetical protein LTR53_003190 [Teratosphaeriaceae sp. CCFEE 6253]